MGLKDFFLGVFATLLVVAAIIVALLTKENRSLKYKKTAESPSDNSKSFESKEGDDSAKEVRADSMEEEVSSKTKKQAYPDASGIPVEWYDSVYKLNNKYVNDFATANLMQVKLKGNLGQVRVIANCKMIDNSSAGYRLILEDPYDTIKAEPILKEKIPESVINDFLSNIVEIVGISQNNKFKITNIRKSLYKRKCI